MKNYCDLFLNSDFLLLADVFEKKKKNRNGCLENYGLFPSRSLSAPASSWDAVLVMTKVKLDLFSDVGMSLFIKKGM